jgi:hypothetical protein
MQIAEPVFSETSNFSVAAPAAPARHYLWLSKARSGVRWVFDIDDGAGAAVCFVCVLAVFATLVVRLVQLDHSLDSQSLKCTAVDKTTLQMHCEFQ